jgi:dCMP deaminase
MAGRIERHEYFLRMAQLVSLRATCSRRRVGCVLVNWNNHVIATGFNGVPSGVEHCTDVACPGAQLASGTGLDACRAVHAELNSLLQCPTPMEIRAAYCTTAPCMGCTKALMNTSCEEIHFIESYPHALEAEALWLSRLPTADKNVFDWQQHHLETTLTLPRSEDY